MENAKRIMIIGGTGSGKSTIAREIAARYDLPCFHLDRFFWEKKGQMRSRLEVKTELIELYKTEKWVIDGNYSDSWSERAEYADAVLFLDINTIVRSLRIIKRSIAKTPINDGSLQSFDFKLLIYAMKYKKEGRIKAIEFMKSKQVSGKGYWCKSASQVPLL